MRAPSTDPLFVVFPPLALAVLGLALALPGHAAVLLLCGAAVIVAVISAVHHAEVVAHRVGEPFGTLVLALAVTVIEVALIVSMMLSARGSEAAALPRDTIYATIMIITTGVIGLCMLIGGLMHRVQSFQTEGARPALSVLVTLSVLTLVLPRFTTSAPGGHYTTVQQLFIAFASLSLWGVFLFGQTVRHRDYFLDPDAEHDPASHAPPPSARKALGSLGLLLLSLVAVVGLAKMLSPAIEAAVAAAGFPRAVIGIAIALLVLAPETVAAARAAMANRLQTSLNLALGSALASIGLTIPAVVVVAMMVGLPLDLGLAGKDLVLLALSIVVSVITLSARRTNMMHGAVHLVIFAAFLLLALVP